MGRKREIIEMLERAKTRKDKSLANVLAYLAPTHDLRKRGVKREKKKEVDADGNVLRNAYLPHLAISATCYARTWKMLDKAMKIWGRPDATAGDVWEKRLLLACEHIVRFIANDIDDEEMMKQIIRLVSPLKKSEYIRNKKAK